MRSLTSTESAAAILAISVVRSLPRVSGIVMTTGSSVSAILVLIGSI